MNASTAILIGVGVTALVGLGIYVVKLEKDLADQRKQITVSQIISTGQKILSLL